MRYVRKKVYARYYGHYGSGGVPWSSVPDNPTVLYDCLKNLPDVATQVADARALGIDGFICSWQGPQAWQTKGWDLLTQASAARTDFKNSIIIETTLANASHSTAEPPDPAVLTEWLTYIYQNYAKAPSYLKLFTKPVAHIYRCDEELLSVAVWQEIVTGLRAKGIDFFYVCMPLKCDERWLDVFDGVSLDNPFDGPTEWMHITLHDWRGLCLKRNKLWGVQIIPGGGTAQRDREGGYCYRYAYDTAELLTPDWLVIGSWNNYMAGERTEIQATVQHGDKYETLTAQYIQKFKGGSV